MNVDRESQTSTYDDADDVATRRPIPTTVLIPALGFGLIGVLLTFVGGLRALAGAGGGWWLLVAAGCVATGVGLWRAKRWAHGLAFPIAGLVVLASLGRDPSVMIAGVAVGVGALVALSRRDAKDWFGFR